MKITDYALAETLKGSIAADVDQFLEWWKISADKEGADLFPADMTTDQWIEQFWMWMEGS